MPKKFTYQFRIQMYDCIQIKYAVIGKVRILLEYFNDLFD